MNLIMQMASSVLFGLVGIVLLVVGYKVIDFVIPADLNKEIEKGNVSAGLVVAGFFITVGIIVAAAIQ